jgi:phage-related protein
VGNTADLGIYIRATDEASAVLGNIEKKAGGLGQTVGKIGTIAGGFIMAQGVMQAPQLLENATQAAADHEAAQIRLKTAIDNSGTSYEAIKPQIDATIESGEKAGFAYQDQSDALALLTAQTGSADEAQKRMTLAEDLARGAHIDLYTASKLLGKATDENVNVLSRYGIVIQKGAGEAELFGKIQEKFGGQADAFAASSAGQMEAAKIQMHELEVQIGTLLLPVMTALVGVLTTQIIPAIQHFADVVGPPLTAAFEQLKGPMNFIGEHKEMVVGALAALGAIVLVTVVPALVTVVPAFIAWAAATIAATWPILAIIAAGALLGLAIKALIDHWDEIKAKTLEVWNSISDFLNDKFGFLKTTFEDAWGRIKTIVTTYLDMIQVYFTTWFKVLKDIFDFASAVFHGDWQAAWDAIKQLVSDVLDGIKATVSDGLKLLGALMGLAWDAVKAQAQVSWQALHDVIAYVWAVIVGEIRAFPGQILGALGDLSHLLFDAGKALIQGLWDGIENLVPGLLNRARDIAGDIAGAIGGALHIGSPSQVMFEMGKNITEGLRLGMQDSWKPLSSALPQMAATIPAAAAGAAQGGIGGITINQTFNGPADPNAVRQAAQQGLYQALRLRGMTP